MKTKQTDVVAEYLGEVDRHLAGLPVLQRRELLADLAAHIAAEKAERNLTSEGEIIEVLERLGNPEVIATAAYEEAAAAGHPVTPGSAPAPARPRRWWLIALIVAGVTLVLLLLAFFMFFARVDSASVETPAWPAVTEPVGPAPTR